MGCCKCEEQYVGWDDPQPVVYADPTEGKEYCVFHAPKDKKRKELGSDECITVEEFNELVFTRINAVSARVQAGDSNARCVLSRTIFPGNIFFNRFGKENKLPQINLSSTRFEDGAFFGVTNFGAEAWFYSAIFCGQVWFYGTVFHGRVSFSNARFMDIVEFEETEFNNRTTFDYTTFNGRAAFLNAKGTTNGNVQLMGMTANSLENLICTRAELPIFCFHNCRWPVRLGLERFGDDLFREPGSPANLLGCEELYRATKQRAAGEHDQLMVSWWHFREKLMQLKGLLLPAKANSLVDAFEDHSLCGRTRAQAWWDLFRALPWKLRRSLLFMYWTCSGFGERPRRAAVCLFVLAMLPLVLLVPLKLLETGLTWRIDLIRVGEVIAEWVRCMPLVKLDAAIVQEAPLVSSVRAGLSWLFQVVIAIQAALFALAVRNRFRR